MVNDKEKIKRLLQIYKCISIFSKINNGRETLEKHIEATRPIEPYFEPFYPEYDEDLYIRKAKEQENGKYAGFRYICFISTFIIAGTVIGLAFCWIPLCVALCSYPVQVGLRRREAYKIYIRECDELKNKYGFTHEKSEINYEKNKLKKEEYDKNVEYFEKKKKWVESLYVNVNSKGNSLEKEKIRLFREIGLSSIYFEDYAFLITVNYLLDKNPNYDIAQLTNLYKSTDSKVKNDLQRDFMNDCNSIADQIYTDLRKHIEEDGNIFADNYPRTKLEELYESI